jgi:hypothetical protein
MSTLAVLVRRFAPGALVVLTMIACQLRCYADASSASLSVSIADTSGAVIPGAEVVIRDVETNQEQHLNSGRSGYASFNFLKPGHYSLAVSKVGFADISVKDILLNVGDQRQLQLVLKVGSASQTVTVDGSGSTINTTDASVSTVIDRKFVENTPLNGRSFQSLILLTPGSVTNTPQRASSIGTSGEFSINGQRTESNYYTVDGVSANIGIAAGVNGGGTSGSVAASTALGTTQALVSVDALQEFRVESSTYSAEYGRNPGGQFSMVTRSGTNDWHGSAFEYFRNDVLDANSWFNDNTAPITKKTAERQNDFGGTVGGPVQIPHLYDGKNRSFFFFSYEGLRLVQPIAASINAVPDLALRQSAVGLMQQVLNAFPQPTTTTDLTPGLGAYVGGWSNPSREDAASVRIDHSVGSRDHAFFRFSDTPSTTATRGTSTNSSPSIVVTSSYSAKTYTFGNTLSIRPWLTTETRLNFSSNSLRTQYANDSFGGAVPVNLVDLESLTPDSQLQVAIITGGYSPTLTELQTASHQQQWNVVQTLVAQRNKHALKMGIDWRRLTPFVNVGASAVAYYFYSTSTAAANSLDLGSAHSNKPFYPLYSNFSAFLQDEWKVAPRLSVSAGIRWDVNPAPGVTQGLMPYTVVGLNNLATTSLAPQGTRLWNTSWYNFAPRLGLAYSTNANADHQTVLRAGGGVFFDTGQQTGSYGFLGVGLAAQNLFGSLYGVPASFPVPVATATPVVVPPQPRYSTVYTNPPDLELPYTFQWNASLEQALGRSQSFTISYVGSNARKLLELSQLNVSAINPSFSTLVVYKNGLSSNYNSLQLKFQRRITHGLQVLGTYTWAHALDYGSYNASFPYQYGNSDYDVRHNATVALSYDIVGTKQNDWLNALTRDWGVDGRFTVRTGFPVTLSGNSSYDLVTEQLSYGGLNRVPGVPLYVSGTTVYGRERINPLAFAVPASGQVGNAPRNFVTGFGAIQTDVAIRREFPILDRLHGQFRIESFNLLNHPNFGTIGAICGGAINSTCTNVQFGQATAILSQSLGGLSPIYQMGGPRSLQASLRLTF